MTTSSHSDRKPSVVTGGLKNWPIPSAEASGSKLKLALLNYYVSQLNEFSPSVTDSAHSCGQYTCYGSPRLASQSQAYQEVERNVPSYGRTCSVVLLCISADDSWKYFSKRRH